MRTIKFRGKMVDNGEWVYGLLVSIFIDPTPITGDKDIEVKTAIQTNHLSFEKARNYEVHPETIGQFTGLLDKDGKEIYEGDVRKDRRYNGTPGDFMRFIGKVEYRHGKFVLTGVKKYEGLHADLFATGHHLGNIHDNPELL